MVRWLGGLSLCLATLCFWLPAPIASAPAPLLPARRAPAASVSPGPLLPTTLPPARPSPLAPPLTWSQIQQTAYPNQLAKPANVPVTQGAAPRELDELKGDSLITSDQDALVTAPVTVEVPVKPILIAQQPLQEVTRLDKTIYFTFDDGPSPGWTLKVLATLARYQAKATFFMIGVNVVHNPTLVQAVVKAGDTVGNHTYDHKSLRNIGRQGFTQEVQATQQALGTVGTHCLRPPYGAIDAFTASYAKALGFRLVLWNIDPRDWARPGVKVIVQRILARAYPGAIVLMHDGGGDRSQTVAALDIVLRTLSILGYHFEPYCTQ